jgi:hypothetical protein
VVAKSSKVGDSLYTDSSMRRHLYSLLILHVHMLCRELPTS